MNSRLPMGTNRRVRLWPLLVVIAVAAGHGGQVCSAATVFGSDQSPITVETGPGGSVAKVFEFDACVTDVVDLWTWGFDAISPTDGPAGPKPTITDAVQGAWWLHDFDKAEVAPAWWYVFGPAGEPDDVQTGSGALARLTVDYEGVLPGAYTLTFESVELAKWVVDDPGPPPRGHFEPIAVTVEDLTIIVQAGVPPEPDPMAWELPPFAVSTSEIQMRAAQAVDDHSPPAEVEYRFDADGVPSAWQAGRDYAHPGQGVNTLHQYRVQARDGVGNETAWTVLGDACTLAATPGPLACDMTVGSLNLNGPAPMSLGITGIALNGNPPETAIAIQIGNAPGAGWLRFVNSGPPDNRDDLYATGTSPEWHTAAAWARRLRGLDPDTSYTFYAKARNAADVETASVEVGTYQTNKDGDVNRSGRATAIDYAWIKQYIINGITVGLDQPWAGDVDGTGALDVGDLNHERWRILHPFAP